MEEKLIFCTLFDKSYLSRGLVLYDSILRNNSNFHLYVFAFDDICYQFLRDLGLVNMTPISLDEFEDQALIQVKPNRTIAEYCWTCTASTIWYVLNKFSVTHCTYLDADMCFYSDPRILYNEMGNKAVLITEHRYTNPGELEKLAGIYNVQFVCFKNNVDGRNACLWWREQCINWCFNKFEDGKFGDQKYLDDWPMRFPSVHVLKNEGGGLATWNIQQYRIRKLSNGQLFVVNRRTKGKFEMVFYHFHALKFFQENIVSLSPDRLSNEVKKLIYFPYVRLLLEKSAIIQSINNQFNPNGVFSESPQKPLSLRDKLYILRSETIQELRSFNFSGVKEKFISLNNIFREHNYFYLNQIEND